MQARKTQARKWSRKPTIYPFKLSTEYPNPPGRSTFWLLIACSFPFVLLKRTTYWIGSTGLVSGGGIAIFANWRKYKTRTPKSTAAFLICRTERRAYPTSWSSRKIRTPGTPRKSRWRLLRTLYANIATPAIPSWIRVWVALQRQSRLYVPGATG